MSRSQISFPIIPCAAIILCSALTCSPAQDVPAGFKVERYTRLWEHNPFTEVRPIAPAVHFSVADKLFLTSWLIDAGKEVISVQNSETGEVQTITAESNQNNLRLVRIQLSANPQFVEAVISDGNEQGTVKFRLADQNPVTPATTAMAQPVNSNAPVGRQSDATGVAFRNPHPAANLPTARTPVSPLNAPVNRRPPHRGIPVFRPGVG
jgi:hypothetical protein